MTVKCDLSSTALKTPDGLVLVDPIALAASALDALAGEATPAAVILTNGNHARNASAFRKEFGVPILAGAAAVAALEIQVDCLLADGELAPGGLRIIEIPGAAPGEIALVGCGVVCIGDALIHLPPHGLRLLPEKYCGDAAALPDSLRKLLSCEFDVMTFAHGAPLVGRARQSLEMLLS
jgi:glyoxylase-like metal-dependent hydrolase (beta-lactamase superfamily II)